eukprot:CAMPEP_0195526272 /NCGR_PEP_ID=MMETSP0794_2-20130614/27232_1 /TAXON_ID=515487 /ORGANISM="Stephanopyxis turris, Strain CCMP 815" /LENGTH=230 /DNA_ID=CAMNT_0040656917 /DNA_START=181 /DNA_END=873 /DNA_ORIENTATION=+
MEFEDIPARAHGESKNTINFDFESLRRFLAFIANQVNKRVTIDTIRPFPLFLGVTGSAFCFSPTAFTPPSKHIDKTFIEKFRARLTLNFKFFLSNYALVTAGVAVVVALMNPSMLLYVGVVCVLWWLHNFTLVNKIPLVVAGKDMGSFLTPFNRTAILAILTVLVIVSKCLLPIMSVLVISAFIILFHATMRDPKDVESSSVFKGKGSDIDGDDPDTDEERVMVERQDAV